MLEVSASEIVTADKMRGVGPANIIFTAGPNPVAEDRRGVAKVTAGGESKNVTITQAAGEQVVVIPEFDYLVLRYGWESEDGSDFDTATGFTNTGISDVDNKYVGWSKQWATTKQQVGDYLIYGGDNMQSGLEGALIKMKTLLSAPGMDESEPNINADIYGNWRSEERRVGKEVRDRNVTGVSDVCSSDLISDVDNKYVGWSKQWATTKQQVGDYLIYGGDNMQSGLEGALIKMKTLLSAPGMDESEPNINADIYGNW